MLTHPSEYLSQADIPTIILACKSDPETTREIDAGYGNSLGEPYNVGLIEVTSMTPEGKSKMRNGLRWLLFKLEQRCRKLRWPSLLFDPSLMVTADRQHRRPSNLALPSKADTHTGIARPITAIPPDLQSPDSEGHSSGGDRIMWGHARHLTMTSSEVEGSDKRSSSGSLEWITNAPIKVQVDAEEGPAGTDGIVTGLPDHDAAPQVYLDEQEQGPEARLEGKQVNGNM